MLDELLDRSGSCSAWDPLAARKSESRSSPARSSECAPAATPSSVRREASVRQQDCGLDDRYCISPQSRPDPPAHRGRSLRVDARRHPDGEGLRSSDSSYSADAVTREHRP